MVAEGVPHPLTQRGNNRQDVFLQDADRRLYIKTIRTKAQGHDLTVLGYCLMTNHVHLAVVPKRPTSLARAVGHAHRRYTAAFNRKYGRSGHLWQNRFYSCPLGPGHLVAAPAYVDLNPVRAGLVGKARQYPWSIAGAHTAAGAGDPSPIFPVRSADGETILVRRE